MATATKQKKTFKESMQETGGKVKAYGQKKVEQVKTMARSTVLISVPLTTLAISVVGMIVMISRIV